MSKKKPNPQPASVDPIIAEATEMLVGRTIRRVEVMSNELTAQMGWDRRSCVLYLGPVPGAKPGTEEASTIIMFAQSDDEGNDAGALAYGSVGLLPVMD